MSDTCIEAYFHMVYCVKYRAAMIAPSWKERLHQYSIGIVENHGHNVLAINTMPDHLHLLFRYNINELIPHLMQHLKRDTSRWINQQGFTDKRFSWQCGYGGFVVEPGRIDRVIRYIQNQEEHHRKKGMRQEILEMLERDRIPYDPRYGFQELE